MTKPASPIESLEYEVAIFWRRARARSHEIAREVHPDIESDAYGLLVHLHKGKPARVSELASYFGVGQPTMSRQLKLLEGLGLIERQPDPDDGRATIIRLTSEGQARVTEARTARRTNFRESLSDWSSQDIAELARLLGKLNSGF